MSKIIDDRSAHTGPDALPDTGQVAREHAIKQIERRRRYWISTAICTAGMLLLAVIGAVTESRSSR